MKTGRLLTAVIASALLISPSFADSQTAPLAAGKPAGVHQADLATPTLLAIGVLVTIGVGVGLVVSNAGSQTSGSTSPSVVATSTTSP